MDQNTTNINELPIDPNPPENRDLPENIVHNLDRTIDVPEKHVTFNKEDTTIDHNETNSLYEITDVNKVMILATLFFLLFSDGKVRSYIMSLLIIIFGNTLKSASGGMSKIGLIMYSSVYGLSLFLVFYLIEVLINKFS
jgi:hypothetical protein